MISGSKPRILTVGLPVSIETVHSNQSSAPAQSVSVRVPIGTCHWNSCKRRARAPRGTSNSAVGMNQPLLYSEKVAEIRQQRDYFAKCFPYIKHKRESLLELCFRRWRRHRNNANLPSSSKLLLNESNDTYWRHNLSLDNPKRELRSA